MTLHKSLHIRDASAASLLLSFVCSVPVVLFAGLARGKGGPSDSEWILAWVLWTIAHVGINVIYLSTRRGVFFPALYAWCCSFSVVFAGSVFVAEGIGLQLGLYELVLFVAITAGVFQAILALGVSLFQKTLMSDA